MARQRGQPAETSRPGRSGKPACRGRRQTVMGEHQPDEAAMLIEDEHPAGRRFGGAVE